MNPIVQEITIKAPAERIFAALTNPEERLKWWWGAKGIFEVTHVESDLRPGGKWKMRGDGAGGKPLAVSGVYRTIERPRLLVFTWLPDWYEDATDTLVRWDLDEKDGATTVRVTHSGFTTESDRATYRGWPQILGGLQAYMDQQVQAGLGWSDPFPVMDTPKNFDIFPIGYVHSSLKERAGAPRQGCEGAPAAVLEILPTFAQGLEGIRAGEDVWILTWLHQSERSVLKVHPRDDVRNPEMGVFATRSPDRPNPIGLHRAKVLSVDEYRRITVDGIEAIHGTPIIDIKPVLERQSGRIIEY